MKTHSSPSCHLPPRPLVFLKAGSEQAPSGARAFFQWLPLACRPHSEQVFQLPGDSLIGTEPLPRHSLQPQGIMSKWTWGIGLKCHWSHSPQASSCWREMRGRLWLERHAISQTAYLRPSFSTHPSCLMAAVAWHFAQEGGTGPARNSVSIQREPCCPGMERNHIEEPLGPWAFHTSISHSPMRWLLSLCHSGRQCYRGRVRTGVQA